MSQGTILRRPTLIILGLGEAGQKILIHTLKLMSRLGMIDLIEYEKNEDEYVDRERGKIEPLKLVYPLEVNLNRSENIDKGLKEMLRGVREHSKSIETTFIKPAHTQQDYAQHTITYEYIKEIVVKYNPIISRIYGISMLRIDLDESMLKIVGIQLFSDKLPVPPGIAITSKEVRVYDEALEQEVVLQPTGGSRGRSSAVYNLLMKTDSSMIFNILGLPSSFRGVDGSVAKSPLAILAYRSFILIHGLVGSGAGASAALLDTLTGISHELLDSKFKIDLFVIPSAQEAWWGKHESSRQWIKVFKWDVEKLIEFVKKGALDALIAVDLDFAIIQQRVRDIIMSRQYFVDEIKDYNKFMIRLLDGELKLYRIDELRKYTGNVLQQDYDRVDEIIAPVLEPILIVHGPRGIKFGVGGSSVDEMELKEMMKGYVSIPMIASSKVFEKYLLLANQGIEKGNDVVEESLAALILPPIHGVLAPITRKLAEKFIVIINKSCLLRLEKLGYVPTPSDISSILQDIFTSNVSVKIFVSNIDMTSSVVIYALAKPLSYLEQVVAIKGWE